MLPETELRRRTPGSGVGLEGTDDEISNERTVWSQSELLTEHTVLRRLQGAMSYKFRTGLDVNKEVNGNP